MHSRILTGAPLLCALSEQQLLEGKLLPVTAAEIVIHTTQSCHQLRGARFASWRCQHSLQCTTCSSLPGPSMTQLQKQHVLAGDSPST